MRPPDSVESINKGGLIVAGAVYKGKPRVDMSVLGDRKLAVIGTLFKKQKGSSAMPIGATRWRAGRYPDSLASSAATFNRRSRTSPWSA